MMGNFELTERPNSAVTDGLDADQKLVVETTEGYVRVIAGAGSGKTRTLTHRYLYLVRELGISPSNILCATFSNKAAFEMKKRVRALLKGDDSGYISTFHSFCVRLLREDIHVIQFPKEFLVVDEEDEKSLIKKAYAELGFSLKDMRISSMMDFIGGRKANDLNYVEFFAESSAENLLEKVKTAPDKWHQVYYRYLYEQKKNFALDFDDLILVALYILQRFPEKLKKWSERMMYVMVDEFQDIDLQQYQLAELLSSYHHNLFVVGDPDQTIYGWRGADVNRILEFDKVHKDAVTILLQNNYRSTPSILKLPDAVIKNNEYRIEKVLKPVRTGGKTPVFCHAKNTREEASWIVERIQDALANGVSKKDIAVLYRMHAQSRAVEEALMTADIPYKIYSGVGFYQRQEIKDAICYLRMLVYGDDLSFARTVNTPKRQFGPKKMAALESLAIQLNESLYDSLLQIFAVAGELPLTESKGSEVATRFPLTVDQCKAFVAKTKVREYVELIEKYRGRFREMPVTEVFTRLMRESRYEEMLRLDGDENRLDNLAELKRGLLEFENYLEEDASLDEFLQNIVLFTNADDEDSDRDRVQLMTVHNSKGLEFPYVFVCGLNEGFFPVKRIESKAQLEEERRLAYVAFTRAENVLCLSDAEDSLGEGGSRYPSRFILEMDMADLNVVRGFSESLLQEARAYIAEADRNREFLSDESLGLLNQAPKAEFAVGDRVYHRIMGFGVVESVDETQLSYRIKFDKVETPRAIQFVFPLKRVMEQ